MFHFYGPDPYLLRQMHNRISRFHETGRTHRLNTIYEDIDGNTIMPCIVFGGTYQNQVPYGDNADWSPITDWLIEQDIHYLTYSCFTGEWKRSFGFLREEDAVLFKLRFM